MPNMANELPPEVTLMGARVDLREQILCESQNLLSNI
jgi:hypothetical protein